MEKILPQELSRVEQMFSASYVRRLNGTWMNHNFQMHIPRRSPTICPPIRVSLEDSTSQYWPELLSIAQQHTVQSSCRAPLVLLPSGTHQLRSSNSSSSSCSSGIGHGHESATLLITRAWAGRLGPHVTHQSKSAPFTRGPSFTWQLSPERAACTTVLSCWQDFPIIHQETFRFDHK